MIRFSTASYTSPMFTANSRQKRKTKFNSQQQQQNQLPTNNKNAMSSKIKTGALVTSAILAGFGIGNINSCSNSKEDLNKPEIEQVTFVKDSIKNSETESGKTFQLKDSIIDQDTITKTEDKKETIEEKNEKKENKDINKEKKVKEKKQTTKPKTQKTQPKETSQPKNDKSDTKLTDEEMEMIILEMLYE